MAPEERISISSTLSNWDMVRSLFNVLCFSEPETYKYRLGEDRSSEAELQPVLDLFGGTILRAKFHSTYSNELLISSEDKILLRLSKDGQNWSFDLAGPDLESLQAWRDKLLDAIPKVEARSDREISVGFWALDGQGNPHREPRRIMGNMWSEIQGNYPDKVRLKLQDLMDLDVPDSGGKLILAHGPAGCGKTHWIRALAHAWKDWCTIDYVVDPESYFQHAFYMLSTLQDDEDKWRLLIVEDAGEFLRSDAKAQTGQGLSRLLNLTDGLLGQGLKLLILMTTNEEMREIHEAVHRPGRCISTISFDAFERKEAMAWAQSQGVTLDKVGDKTTLAELYHEIGTIKHIAKGKTEYVPGGYA